MTPNLRKETVASLDASSNVEAKIKQPKVLVEVKYSVYETRGNSCDEVRGKKKLLQHSNCWIVLISTFFKALELLIFRESP